MIEINKGLKTAVLIGGTGLVGSHCLRLLVRHEAYKKVITFGRRPLDTSHQKIEHHIIDFKNIDKHIKLIKGDDFFSCLGTTVGDAGSKKRFIQVDFTYNLTFAKIAEKQKFNQYLLVSSVGANANSLFFYNKVKGYLENEIKKIPFWSTHIFRPSVLLGKRSNQRIGEQAAGKIGSVLDRVSGGMLMKYKPVEAEVVASAMVYAAQRFDAGLHIYPSHELQKLAERYFQEKD